MFLTYRRCKSRSLVQRGRVVATHQPCPSFLGGYMWCFLDEGGLKVDVSLAGEWFAEAVDQLIHADVDEDDVPFLLFLCGAEAALRTQEQRDEVLH